MLVQDTDVDKLEVLGLVSAHLTAYQKEKQYAMFSITV